MSPNIPYDIDYFSELKKFGLSEIVYSLNLSLLDESVTKSREEIPDFMRKFLSNGVINLESVTAFLESISAFMPVSIHFCLTSLTKDDLKDLDSCISKINQDNFKSLSFLRYVPHGRGDSSLTLSSKELKELKPHLIEFVRKYPNKVKFGSPFNILDISYTPCTAGDETIIIGSDGSVYPCDAMKYFDALGSGGNIYNQSLMSIYKSPYFAAVRSASKTMNEECKECNNTNCHGGCLAQKMLDMVETKRIYNANLVSRKCLKNH